VATNVLDDLMRKAERFRERTGAQDVRYALFARAGFTPALVERARGEGVLLVGLAEMVEG
jgi:hypothetical protein